MNKKQKEILVWEVSVKTKPIYRDVFQSARNLLGMNLIAYEAMIDDAFAETYGKLIKKYPEVKDTRFTTTQIANGACEVICYGKAMVNEDAEILDILKSKKIDWKKFKKKQNPLTWKQKLIGILIKVIPIVLVLWLIFR